MYYHFQEIGRSANTGHLLEMLSPQSSCAPLVFGDEESESKLIDEMVLEHAENRVATCVLYPSSDAASLAEWAASNKRTNNVCDNGGGVNNVGAGDFVGVRMIALDGTYRWFTSFFY